MILRLAAALALVLGFGGFGGYLVLIGKSPFSSEEARHLRDMKDRGETPASFQAMTLADFEALPRNASLAEYSGFERRGVTLEGYMQRMLRAPDGDVHFEVVDSLPVGYARPYVTVEVATLGPAARPWSWSEMEWDLRPWRSPAMDPWNSPPRRMRVSGWLLYDFQHEQGPPVPGSRNPRVSAWEIHPVTAIDVWSESRAGWEPLER